MTPIRGPFFRTLTLVATIPVAAAAAPRAAAPARAARTAAPPVNAPGTSAPAGPSSLAARLAEAAASPVFQPLETGIAVIEIPGGVSVFERNAHKLLKPASTLKILTSSAALALLKPEFVFETHAYAAAPLGADGTLDGDLYLQGRGAPDLVGESWWLLARRLADRGLRRVTGNLVADETYFDAVRRPPGWPAPAADSWYNAPIGALSCNFNVVTVHVEPSPLLGARPDLTLEPAASYFQVLNRATTSGQPTDIRVDRAYEDGRNTLVVGGTIRRGSPEVVLHRAVEEPALYALNVFREIARGCGIEVAGTLTTGIVPEGARSLARHESRPLGALVRDMNKNSNNFMAEMILKTLGAQFVAIPGTTAGGLEMVRAYVSGLGLDPEETALADGSGLSDQTRATAALLARVLARAAGDFEIGPELVSSLPIGGADGTLSDRFAGEEARRRVRAKTGKINGVVSLAGYVANRDGRTFAFVVLANQPRGTIDAVHRAIDRIADVVASSRDADLPAPAPPAAARRARDARPGA